MAVARRRRAVQERVRLIGLKERNVAKPVKPFINPAMARRLAATLIFWLVLSVKITSRSERIRLQPCRVPAGGEELKRIGGRKGK
jgi:hypothetical protein